MRELVSDVCWMKGQLRARVRLGGVTGLGVGGF